METDAATEEQSGIIVKPSRVSSLMLTKLLPLPQRWLAHQQLNATATDVCPERSCVLHWWRR